MTRKPQGAKVSNINVMLNTLDATRHWKLSEDGLSIRNDGSTFESIRATKSVTCGKWFYEVKLVTAGIMQIGWATVHCQFSPEDGTGVGDDIVSACRRINESGPHVFLPRDECSSNVSNYEKPNCQGLTPSFSLLALLVWICIRWMSEPDLG